MSLHFRPDLLQVEVAGDVRWVVKKDGAHSGIGIRFQGLRARDVWALNQFFQSGSV